MFYYSEACGEKLAETFSSVPAAFDNVSMLSLSWRRALPLVAWRWPELGSCLACIFGPRLLPEEAGDVGCEGGDVTVCWSTLQVKGDHVMILR